MGNCCTVGSSVEWAGDDWGSLTSRHGKSSRKVFDEDGHGLNKLGNVEKERLVGALRAASSDASGKVKIMISKKELKELLRGSSSDHKQHQAVVGAGNHHHHHASAEQVLVRLIYARDHHDLHDAHHRPWRPVLQSIPEVN